MDREHGLVQNERRRQMSDLIRFCWWIFIIFTTFSLLLCIEARWRYRRKRGIDDDENFHGRYRYFGQTIRSGQRQVIGYELLLREYDGSTGKWHLPNRVSDFPLSRVVQAVQKVDQQLESQETTLALNMTSSQLLDFRADHFFNWVVGVVDDQILIELNAHDLCDCPWWSRLRLKHRLKQIDHRRIKVVVEGVDSSSRTRRLLRPYLLSVDYLKFNAKAFNKSANHWIDVTLNQWKQYLAKSNVQPVLGRIEEPGQEQLADQLGIKLRQGYIYDQPKLI